MSIQLDNLNERGIVDFLILKDKKYLIVRDSGNYHYSKKLTKKDFAELIEELIVLKNEME